METTLDLKDLLVRDSTPHLVEGFEQKPIWDIVFGEDFADRVAHELGYTLLEKENASYFDPKQAVFHNTLLELDAAPYTPDSIAAYKKARKKEVDIDFGTIWIDSSLLRASSIYFVLSFLCASIVGLATIPTLLFAEPPIALLLSKITVSCLATSVLACSVIIILLFCVRQPARYSWSSIGLQHYLNPVPDFALYKALQIREEFPQTSFKICALQEEQKTYDPFLVVAYYGKEYYIAVWDEPSFRGTKVGEES